MDFYIFHGFPYIFMELTEFYKILQLFTIINIEDICNFFQNISEKITTPQKVLDPKLSKIFLAIIYISRIAIYRHNFYYGEKGHIFST